MLQVAGEAGVPEEPDDELPVLERRGDLAVPGIHPAGGVMQPGADLYDFKLIVLILVFIRFLVKLSNVTRM